MSKQEEILKKIEVLTKVAELLLKKGSTHSFNLIETDILASTRKLNIP